MGYDTNAMQGHVSTKRAIQIVNKTNYKGLILETFSCILVFETVSVNRSKALLTIKNVMNVNLFMNTKELTVVLCWIVASSSPSFGFTTLHNRKPVPSILGSYEFYLSSSPSQHLPATSFLVFLFISF